MALKRVLQYFNIAVVVALIAGLAVVYWFAWRPLPETTGSIAAPVSARVSIGRDALGVPHITAASVEDALFAQGFATAQERLWQMDALRRLASGRLSEILGPDFLEADREVRRLRMDRIAERLVPELAVDERAAMAAYARGVNHFIETARGRQALEFTLLGYDPRPWTVKDSILIGLHMYRELTTTWRDKLSKSAMLAGGDAAKVAALFPERVAGGTQPGSNAWVLAGSRTASGKPLVSNDPHLEYSLPSAWFMVHLRAPGLNVSGVALPGVPGVILGHNERIAWGATNLGYDVQELYIEQIDLRTGRYLFQGRTEQAVFEREAIPVKGAAPAEFAQWVTRHGPVFVEEGRARALRWTAADAGGFTFPFLAIDRARNWQEFTAALAHYAGPGQNFVYGDVDGNIGYHAAGRLPIRSYDGDVPVDGASGQFEWGSYIPFDQLPQSYNPTSGMFVTANDNPFPATYPYRVRGNFAAPYRAEQIRRRISARSKWRAGEMTDVQKDVYSAFAHRLAREIMAAFDRRGVRGGEAGEAIRLLRSWNGQMEKGEAAPFIVNLTYQHLRTALAERASPGKAALYTDASGLGAAYQLAPTVIEDLLRSRPSGWFGDWDQVLLEALTDGLAEGRRIQGRNMSKWDWGNYNRLDLPNPVVSHVPLLGGYFNIGPISQTGSAVTVKQTTRRLGPSMRTTADLADWDRSYMNITTGESGHVLSGHYKDQWDAYYNAHSFPMQFQNVEVKDTLTLEPGSPR